MKQLHFTKKDFTIEFYSGTGPGGQNRNKVMACCRITHKETGLKAQSTSSRSRSENQRKAFNSLARRLVSHYSDVGRSRFAAGSETIRNYHKERNEVHDKASGLRLQYSEVVGGGDIGRMIDARRAAIGGQL
jgi:protein subunit release factor B